MNFQDNEEQALQRSIEQQEQAMAAVLGRIIQAPLAPICEALEEVQEQLYQQEKAGKMLNMTISASVTEAVEESTLRLNRNLAGVKHTVDEMREQAASQATALGNGFAAQADHQTRLDAGIAGLRDAGQAGTDRLLRDVTGLGRQQAQLTERVDALQPALAPRLDRLQAAVDDSARDIADAYASFSDKQKAIVSAVVQQELALQLAPLQKRSGWLAAMCAASLLSSLAVLGLALLR